MTKIIKVIFGIILTILIFFGVVVLFTFLPIPGNVQLFTVLSGSMEPSIKTGALVFVKPFAQYGVGDVVTYRADENTTFTHRIITRNEENGTVIFQTQGDANNAADDLIVDKEMILGKVFLDVPYMGYIVNFAQTKSGIVLFVIFPAMIILIQEFFVIKKEVQKIKKNNRKKQAKNHLYPDELMIDHMVEQYADPAIKQIAKKPRKIIKIE